jgi:hypothetical protein
MITRTAIFEGVVRAGCEDAFFAGFEALLPLWKRFPHATNVRLLRVTAADPGAPPIVLVQQIDYPSEAAVAEALASPVRAEARAATLALMEMFEGRLYHLLSPTRA